MGRESIVPSARRAWTSVPPPSGQALLRMALPSLMLCALAGCAALPSSGPDSNQVVSASQGPAPAFRIVDLTDKAAKDLAAAFH